MRKVRHRTAGGAPGPGRSVLVDSGAWIALIRATDSHHVHADGMFRQALAQRIRLLTTNLIVGEVHRFLLFHAGVRPATVVLDRMGQSSNLTIQFATAQHHGAARRWLARFPDQHITYTDAVSFAIMEAHGCATAMSFDRDFVIAGFSLWDWNR